MPPLSIVLVRELVCRIVRVVVVVALVVAAFYFAAFVGAWDAAYFGGSP
jgi:hypothetical protein